MTAMVFILLAMGENVFCCRYIYLWINYALWEEVENGDLDRARLIYTACLKTIPEKHSHFSFSKVSEEGEKKAAVSEQKFEEVVISSIAGWWNVEECSGRTSEGFVLLFLALSHCLPLLPSCFGVFRCVFGEGKRGGCV